MRQTNKKINLKCSFVFFLDLVRHKNTNTALKKRLIESKRKYRNQHFVKKCRNEKIKIEINVYIN